MEKQIDQNKLLKIKIRRKKFTQKIKDFQNFTSLLNQVSVHFRTEISAGTETGISVQVSEFRPEPNRISVDH